MSEPQPGDFAVVSIVGPVSPLIRFGEWLNGAGKFDVYQHTFIYTGDGKVVQAEPGGANEVPLTSHPNTLWSSGKIALTDAQRKAIVSRAKAYARAKVPYSFLDYGALAAHRMHLPIPFLRTYIKSTGHMICSQLVDQCYQDAGVELFSDDRWAGDVTPADLAALIS